MPSTVPATRPPTFYVGAHHLNLLWHDAVSCVGDAVAFLQADPGYDELPPRWRHPVEVAASDRDSHHRPLRLFVSYNELARRRSPLPRVRCRWALDSGGFTRLASGRGHARADSYAAAARGLHRNGLDFACVQDWPEFTRDQTGLDLAAHQRRTAESYAVLTAIAPDVLWAPVLVGDSPDQLDRHLAMHLDVGRAVHDPFLGAPVALGGFAQRLDDPALPGLVAHLYVRGCSRVHVLGLGAAGAGIPATSGDSQAWSATFRRERLRVPGHRHGRGGDCRNCPTAMLLGYFASRQAFAVTAAA